jgi:hypothetical protein
MTESEWIGLWSVTNGLMPLGAMVGGFSSGYVADLLGRSVWFDISTQNKQVIFFCFLVKNLCFM